MGERWARFKARHWEEKARISAVGMGIDTPRLRRIARWFATHWQRQPFAMLGAGAAVVAAVAALIRALR